MTVKIETTKLRKVIKIIGSNAPGFICKVYDNKMSIDVICNLNITCTHLELPVEYPKELAETSFGITIDKFNNILPNINEKITELELIKDNDDNEFVRIHAGSVNEVLPFNRKEMNRKNRFYIIDTSKHSCVNFNVKTFLEHLKQLKYEKQKVVDVILRMRCNKDNMLELSSKYNVIKLPVEYIKTNEIPTYYASKPLYKILKTFPKNTKCKLYYKYEEPLQIDAEIDNINISFCLNAYTVNKTLELAFISIFKSNSE